MKVLNIRLSRRGLVALLIVCALAALLPVGFLLRYSKYRSNKAKAMAAVVRQSLGADIVSSADAAQFASELDKSGIAKATVGKRILLLATVPLLMHKTVSPRLPAELRGQLLRAQGHAIRLYVYSSKLCDEGRLMQTRTPSGDDLKFVGLYDPVEQPCFLSRNVP